MSTLTAARKLRIYNKFDWTCVDCGVRYEDTKAMAQMRATGARGLQGGGNHITVDHIIPLARGGTNAVVNLVAMCYECNQRKGREQSKQRKYKPGGNRNTRRRAERRKRAKMRAASNVSIAPDVAAR